MAGIRVQPSIAFLRDSAASVIANLSAALQGKNSPATQQCPSEGEIRVLVSRSDAAVFSIARGEIREIARVALDDVERGAHALEGLNVGRSDTIVMLPAAEALRRLVQLPIGASTKLRKILRHELDRHSPIDPAQVYFDYWIKVRDNAANRLEVELRIVKRSSIERAVTLCRSIGLEPVSVGIDGDLVPLNRAELPLKRAAVVRSLWRRWSVPALAVLIFFLAVATIAGFLARNELAASMLDVRVGEARAKAAVVLRLRDEIAGAQKRAAFLAGEKRSPMAVQVLAELTRALPDNTWIYSFQLTGREIRIRGFSPAASALIGAFDKSGFFANAQFRAPLTQGPQSGVERFDISLDLKGTAS